MLPYLTHQPPWFAFLAHPRDEGDLLPAGVGSVVRHYSTSESDFVAKLCSLPPLVAGGIRFGFAAISGELVVAMCLPHQIMRRAGQRAVIRAAQLAAERGARVVGLGGLTAPATGGGALLLPHLPS